MCTGVLSVCMSVYCVCVPGVYRDQKRELDPLQLELQRAVSCHVGAGV